MTSQLASHVNLGQSLRTRRKELSLTMQEVASSAGLTVGFISQVERGLATPSLASLVSISAALGVPVASFLEQPPAPRPHTRQTERVHYAVGPGSVAYERVSSSFEGSRLRSVIVHEPSGYRVEPISHPGEELIYVLSGGLTAEVDGQRTILGPGDSIHFDSRLTHSTWNHTTDTTVMLWCGTMDVFGEDGPPDPIHRSAREPRKARAPGDPGKTTRGGTTT